MKTHMFEHAGVLLLVQYRVGDDQLPEFDSIHVTDTDYRPVGPDLIPLLRETCVILPTNHQPPAEPQEAADFLSLIAEDLANVTSSTIQH